jgi:hypothetical protein
VLNIYLHPSAHFSSNPSYEGDIPLSPQYCRISSKFHTVTNSGSSIFVDPYRC